MPASMHVIKSPTVNYNTARRCLNFTGQIFWIYFI